jgi:hypothetical protein
MIIKIDLRRGLSSYPAGPIMHELNPNNNWDKDVLAEAKLLSKWTGVKDVKFYHCNDGTAASTDDIIFVDRKQLDQFFVHFTGEKYKTAIFFALAHEFGHLCQFKSFGIEETFNKPSIEIEAHADYLSGAWLGLRLFQGEERLSDDLLEAGLQLKSDTPDYPSAYQRGRLVQDAQGLSVLLVHIVEPQIPAGDYIKLEAKLNKSDIFDLYAIAKKRLNEIPIKEPI